MYTDSDITPTDHRYPHAATDTVCPPYFIYKAMTARPSATAPNPATFAGAAAVEAITAPDDVLDALAAEVADLLPLMAEVAADAAEDAADIAEDLADEIADEIAEAAADDAAAALELMAAVGALESVTPALLQMAATTGRMATVGIRISMTITRLRGSL